MHAFRARCLRTASGALALLAMAIVLVAGMLHVAHAMAANAPAALDPHASCTGELATHAHQEAGGHHPPHGERAFGHCPACALAKVLALGPGPLATTLAAPRARAVAAKRPARPARRGRRPEIVARPRAPPTLR